MVTCRQCGAVSRDDSINQCAACGSTYFRTSDLWDQTTADLGRRIGDDALEGKFPFWPMVVSAIKLTAALSAALGAMILLAARLS